MAGSKRKINFTALDITVIGMLAAILFIQEELLSFIPNVQLTVFLLVLYSKKLGFVRTSIIVAIHVFLDNLVMGSFSPMYTPAMFVGWLLTPVIICIFFKKTENPMILGLAAILCSLLYSWCFVIAAYLVYGLDPLVYLAADVVFELILAGCGFITTLLLYKPCAKVFDKMIKA